MRNRLAAVGVAALVMLGGVPAVTWAQSNAEVNAGIQFDFLSPGARSLALGGAFTAMADDATTAFTNPAGLREISRKEFSFEGRIRGFKTPFTTAGHGFGTATGLGVDTITGLVDGRSSETLGSASFLSFVYPQAKWRIAGYRHELARFKSNITTEGAFYGTGSSQRLLPAIGDLEVDIVDYGVAGSYDLSPTVSIGGGLAIYDFSFDSTTRRYSLLGNSVAPASYTTLSRTETQVGSASTVGFNVGIVVQPASAVGIAAVYRRGADFDVAVQSIAETVPSPTVVSDGTGSFHVPDVFSLGLRLDATKSKTLKIALDYTRVQYSQLTDGFFPVLPADPADFQIEDANEVHAGAQYLDPNSKVPIAIRGGVWYDPRHALVYTGADQPLQMQFRERNQSQVHYAFGAGYNIQKIGVEINAGVDLSKLVNTTSISTVIRFGR